jgi:LytTr DNA-binding domain
MPKLFSILQQSYPRGFTSYQSIIRISVITGVFVVFFLIIFQPFEINTWTHPFKWLYLVGYGVVTILMMILIWGGLPKVFPQWHEEQGWTVGKYIIQNIVLILMIALGNINYTKFVLDPTITAPDALEFVYETILIGFFPILAFTYISYINYSHTYSKHTGSVPNPSLEIQAQDAQTNIELIAENEKDTIRLHVNKLLYIESADNYSTVVFRQDSKIKKELLRSSLTRLEGQLLQEFIVRCHRSYIVNLHQVKTITGNAQGYKLHLGDNEMAIPVARKYSDIVVKYFK